MAHVVVLGAGLGGTIMAYELRDQLRAEDTITVVTKDPTYHFVPSNPWIAVGWRKRKEITVDLAPIMKKKKIDFRPVAAERVIPAEKRIALVDGTSISYDYLVIATGPNSPSTKSPASARRGTRSQSAMSTTPNRPMPPSRPSANPPAPSSSARHRAPPALARPTNSCSSSKPNSAAARSATACP